jgi:hypothetical protein
MISFVAAAEGAIERATALELNGWVPKSIRDAWNA